MTSNPIFTPPSAPAAPEPDLEREAEILRARVLADTADGYRQLCRIQKLGIERIWHHPRLTPQQAVDALGTDAAPVFQAHGALTQVIAAVAALDGAEPDIVLPTHAFAVNPDGTVTVGEEPYEPTPD